MQSRIRIAVAVATVLVGAVFLVAISEGSSVPLPGSPPAEQARATAGVPQLLQPIAVDLAELGTSGEAPRGFAAPQRTLVEDCLRESRVPMRGEDLVWHRAAALAKKLDLSAADEEALRAVLLSEQVRRAEAFRELHREPDQAATRARARAELDAILAWKTKKLRSQVGPERADIMMRR